VEVARPALPTTFCVVSAVATRDLVLYRERVPQQIDFDGSNKIYRIALVFTPLFERYPQSVLSVLSLRYGDGGSGDSQLTNQCKLRTALCSTHMDDLAPICRYINLKRLVSFRDYLMSNGESDRVVLSFGSMGPRVYWHVHGFDLESGEFCESVVTCTSAPRLLDDGRKTNERRDNEIQWPRIVELDLVLHPRLYRPEVNWMG